jgi:predicted  nucleic acid-binding Zn-ribbon protein
VYSGSENLRFVGKFKARVVELVTLLNAFTDFKKNLDDTVNLDDYLDMTNLDSLIDENDWSKMDEFKRRINNALDKVYELNGRNLINRNEVIVMTKMDNKKSTVVNVVYDLYTDAQIINDASRI